AVAEAGQRPLDRPALGVEDLVLEQDVDGDTGHGGTHGAGAGRVYERGARPTTAHAGASTGCGSAVGCSPCSRAISIARVTSLPETMPSSAPSSSNTRMRVPGAVPVRATTSRR